MGLIVYGATTKDKLQGVADNKEEFARRLTADKYGVPAAICDMLFAQYVAGKSDRGRSSSGGELDDRSGKRQRILERRNPVGIAKLWSVLHKTKELDGDVLQFENEVLDSRSNMLWVHPSYPEMYDAVWKAGVREETGKAIEFYSVVVTGTSGIGKSFFGVYAAYRSVLEKGITIIFTMYGVDQPIKRYIIAPSLARMESFQSGDPRRFLLDLRKDFPGVLSEDRVDDQEHNSAMGRESLWWGELKDAHPESSTPPAPHVASGSPSQAATELARPCRRWPAVGTRRVQRKEARLLRLPAGCACSGVAYTQGCCRCARCCCCCCCCEREFVVDAFERRARRCCCGCCLRCGCACCGCACCDRLLMVLLLIVLVLLVLLPLRPAVVAVWCCDCCYLAAAAAASSSSCCSDRPLLLQQQQVLLLLLFLRWRQLLLLRLRLLPSPIGEGKVEGCGKGEGCGGEGCEGCGEGCGGGGGGICCSCMTSRLASTARR